MMGVTCWCSERYKPVRERNWVVRARYCNYSAFNGYHYTPSDWSAVRCNACNAYWRTKALYVDRLADG